MIKPLQDRARQLQHDLYMMGYKDESAAVHKCLCELGRLCNQYEKKVEKDLTELADEIRSTL